jgi:acyl-CoA reductase-like NAD-dependent aldehyde dehydrogenase
VIELRSKLWIGGRKSSGHGREGGIEGTLDFVQTKSVSVDLNPSSHTDLFDLSSGGAS